MSPDPLGTLRDGMRVYADSDRTLIDALHQEQQQDRSETHRNGRPSVGAADDSADPGLLAELTSAAALDRKKFPPLVEHVPRLVVEGFGILAGAPKAGKSWLAADIALGCAHGGMVLGAIPVRRRAVLLLALEDGPRRLQARMRRISGDRPLPEQLDVLTKVEPGTVTATVVAWLANHKADENAPLVILDTLGKARPQRRAGDDPYIADYQLGTRIKSVIDDVSGASLIAVHHTRKMKADDFIDTLSGTQGIAGSADYVLVLTRKRKSCEGVLAVTGRDIPENEYAVKTDDGIWSLDGMDILDAAATVTTRAERDQKSRLGDRSLDAMKFLNERAVTTPADLAAHLHIEPKIAGNLLAKLERGGYVSKQSRGRYASHESGETGESTGQDG